MLRLFFALLAVVAVTAAPPPPPPAARGCPNGGVGIGESQICPKTGSCEGLGLTATIYGAGSCTPADNSPEAGNAAFCDNTFVHGAGFACGPAPAYNYTLTLHGKQYKNCVTYDYPHQIVCNATDAGYSEIDICCY